MNEEAARTVYLIKAVEENDREGYLLTANDRQEASLLAGERAKKLDPGTVAEAETGEEGISGADRSYLVERARILAGTLEKRLPWIGSVLKRFEWRPWWGPVVLAGALITGLLTNELGSDQRINILAFPLLGLLAWNVAIYVVLAFTWIRKARSRGEAGAGSAVAAAWLHWVGSIPERLWRPRHTAPPSESDQARLGAILNQFAREWLKVSAPLQSARIGRLLHFGAALVAAGAVGGMYLRGLVLEYRAGWESTFLSAECVHEMLKIALGPASWLTGIPLPGVAEIEALRITRENAAPWIHLYAATAALVILIPRGILGLMTLVQERKARARLEAFPAEDFYFARIISWRKGKGERICVLPYSVQLTEGQKTALRMLILEWRGVRTEVEFCPPVAYGAEEEDLNRLLPEGAPLPDYCLVLFNLSATPEMEAHGRLIAALKARAAEGQPIQLLMVLEESSYRQRLGEAQGWETRLQERRNLWKRLADGVGVEMLGVELDKPDPQRWAADVRRTAASMAVRM